METLACRPAPLFDSGTSLWCTVPFQELRNRAYDYESRQFERSPARQLMLAGDLSWVDPAVLEGFVDEALAILGRNEGLAQRLPYVEEALTRRVDRMAHICAFL